ncbi:hypothetical protein VIOR103205_09045 [Vibrio ordalii]|uniref:hypothetical protein n=1 Tax=Vibrio ordalii TaxID=28174 RepID=UPI00024835BC|nr:hypothetical protein [Vibrio ordalii]
MNKRDYKTTMSAYRLAYNTVLFAMNSDQDNFHHYSQVLKEINQAFQIETLKPKGFDKYDPAYCGAWVIETAMNKRNLSAARASELANKVSHYLDYPYPIDRPSKVKNYNFYKLLLNNLPLKM